MLNLLIQDSWTWVKEKIDKLKPFSIAVVFSPWVIIAYIYIQDFSIHKALEDQDVIRGFIEWFGTAYSLFLALVLVNVWNEFNNLDLEFDREADAIATLFQTANYAHELSKEKESRINGKEQYEGKESQKVIEEKKELGAINQDLNNVIEQINVYVRHVLDNYRSEHVIFHQRRHGERTLEHIGMLLSSIACNQLIRDPLIAELFRNLNEARDVRGDRITHSRQRIPPTIWLVAVIASLVWLIPFFGLDIKKSPY